MLMLSNPNDHIQFIESVFTGSFYIQKALTDLKLEKFRDYLKISYPLESFTIL